MSHLPPYEPSEQDDVQPPVWRVGRYPNESYAPAEAPFSSAYMEPEPASAEAEALAARSRVEARGNPTFGFIVAVALSVGLMPLAPDNTDVRYILVWGVLAFFGVLAWLFGNASRVETEVPENLVWGVVFGALIGLPLLAVGAEPLATTSHRLFRAAIDGQVRPLSAGAVLAMLVFVQPLAETLFFRGLVQDHRPFWFVGGVATLWSILLFFPMLNVSALPLVGVVIAVALLMMNLIYSYVRRRNGLAAAWLCQIVLNFILLFIPYVTS